MGAECSRGGTRASRHPPPPSISLRNFVVIRSIGRGAFGKVCIVQEKATKNYFALKYVSKRRCVERAFTENVLRELQLLTRLSHPFIVNLWHTFQDKDYLFMVSDLLLGGDIRFHLNQQGRFAEDRSKLYAAEIALALGYLHEQGIVHRDVKPENLLLDEKGHAHLTDFNLATRLEANALATSFSGTRPYMAPEILACALGECPGYDWRVDFWSLGISFFEMLRGRPPFEFSSQCSTEQVLMLMKDGQIALPSHWPSDLVSFLAQLLAFDPSKRISSERAFFSHRYMERVDPRKVFNREMAPVFVPSAEALNCDPTYELEERIIESTPIHRHRASPHTTANSNKSSSRLPSTEMDAALQQLSAAFVEFSRDPSGSENLQNSSSIRLR